MQKQAYHLRVLLCLSICSTLGVHAETPDDGETQTGIRTSLATPQKTSETALKIIDLHLKARGGEDKLSSLISVKRYGKIYQGQEDYVVIWTHSFPFNYHINSNRSNLGWNFETVKAYNGSFAWSQEVSPDKKDPEVLSTDEAKQMAFEANLPVLFINHEKKGFIFSYKGEIEFANKSAYVLHAWLYPGFELDIFFDKRNFHILNYRMNDSFAGKIIEVDRMPIGMKKFNGIWFETGFDFRLDGKSYKKYEFTDTRLDLIIDQQIFQAPKKKEVWLKSK